MTDTGSHRRLYLVRHGEAKCRAIELCGAPWLLTSSLREIPAAARRRSFNASSTNSMTCGWLASTHRRCVDGMVGESVSRQSASMAAHDAGQCEVEIEVPRRQIRRRAAWFRATAQR